jgi:hypothetical protein
MEMFKRNNDGASVFSTITLNEKFPKKSAQVATTLPAVVFGRNGVYSHILNRAHKDAQRNQSC